MEIENRIGKATSALTWTGCIKESEQQKSEKWLKCWCLENRNNYHPALRL
jgi:hypothetical protein